MPNVDPVWQSPNMERVFQYVDLRRRPTVGKGSVVTFNYIGQQRNYRIHDPTPVVVVSDVFRDMIRGVNTHYLTLPYVRMLVTNYADNPAFSFAHIRNDAYIVSAFRSYKRNGISQLMMLDTGFLKNLLTVVRSLDPMEIEQMRQQVHQMIQDQSRQAPAQPGPEIR